MFVTENNFAFFLQDYKWNGMEISETNDSSESVYCGISIWEK